MDHNFLTDEHTEYEETLTSDEECLEVALRAYPAFDECVCDAEDTDGGYSAYIEALEDVEIDRLVAIFEAVKYGRAHGLYSIPGRMLIFAVSLYLHTRARLEQERAEAAKPIDGYVYVLRSSTGDWKIGRSKDPSNRIRTFSVKLPFRVQYEIVIPSKDYKALEVELHERFAYCRLDGEWFDLTEGDILDLKDEFQNVASDFND